jgi:muramoyltetrapeptide carboxypeptidase LdcA involved in peptidoglycan recycling
VVFGAIRPFEGSEQERARLAAFVAAQTAHLKCPVLFGIESGHGTENLTLPLGVRARLDSGRRRLVIIEPAVS